MKSNTNLDVLSKAVGKEKAKKLLALNNKFDKQILKFKTEVNKLLETQNIEVKIGLVYEKKE